MGEVPKETLQEILNTFVPLFEAEYGRLCREKLGLKTHMPGDFPLFIELLHIMGQLNVDYTFTFRQLCHYERGRQETLKAFWDYYGARAEMKQWLERYDERLGLEALSDTERRHEMLKNNPKYVLKNYIAQEVIQDVEAGSSERLNKWLEVFYHPYDEHPAFEQYSWPTPSEHKNIEVSCSS